MFIPDNAAKFHCLNLQALQFTKVTPFQNIKFQPISLASSCSSLKRGKCKRTTNSKIYSRLQYKPSCSSLVKLHI